MNDFSPMTEEEKQVIIDNAEDFSSERWSRVDEAGRLHL